MKANIFIPKKINVGFQNRDDTYTGKLAYVIYYDEKGKLRKEKSWNSWRDQNILNEEFDNVPISGFVLNKRAGGVEESYGWNTRKTYCRVYDPRNFEFEITIENLLYILENANSIKGKGLEGDFVYGWSGKDLVLLPVESPDYKEITNYNNIVFNNESIKAKDLIIGATYLDKENTEFVYMGKYDYFSVGYQWIENGEYKTSRHYKDMPYQNGYYTYNKIKYKLINNLCYGKYYWFAYEYDNNKWRFCQYKSISKNKFITCVKTKCSNDYANIYEQMIRNNSYSPIDENKDKYIPYTFDEFKMYAEKEEDRYGTGRYVKYNYRFYSDSGVLYEIRCNKDSNDWTVIRVITTENTEDYYSRFDFVVEPKVHPYKPEIKTMIPMSIETLYKKLKPCYREVYLKNGYLYTKECYYGNDK